MGISFNPEQSSNKVQQGNITPKSLDTNNNKCVDSHELAQALVGQIPAGSSATIKDLETFLCAKQFDYGAFGDEQKAENAFSKYFNNLKEMVTQRFSSSKNDTQSTGPTDDEVNALIQQKANASVPKSSDMTKALSQYNCLIHPKNENILGVKVNGEFMMIERSDKSLYLTRFNGKDMISSGTFKNMSQFESYLNVLKSGDEKSIKKMNQELGINTKAVAAGDYHNNINDVSELRF